MQIQIGRYDAAVAEVFDEFLVNVVPNPLRANPTKWPNTLKQIFGNNQQMF